MSCILYLTLDLAPGTARRLYAELDRDIRAGLDVGPRNAQIACLSGSITRALEDLQTCLAEAVAELPEEHATVRVFRRATLALAHFR